MSVEFFQFEGLRPILTKFRIKHYLVLVRSQNLSTKFELHNSKFAQVRQFRAKTCRKVQNLKKFERSDRFWPNSIPEFLDRCIIFVCSFRMIAQILRKLKLPDIFQKILNPINIRLDTNLHENRGD